MRGLYLGPGGGGCSYSGPLRLTLSSGSREGGSTSFFSLLFASHAEKRDGSILCEDTVTVRRRTVLTGSKTNSGLHFFCQVDQKLKDSSTYQHL